MRILLTGHEGYLGSRLKIYFEELRHVVIGLSRRDDLGSITGPKLREVAPDLVINCATVADRSSTRYCVGGDDEAVNVLAMRELVVALKETGVGLVHLSTKDVYGDVYRDDDVQEVGLRLDPIFSINEQQPLRPTTVYAKTKLVGEFIVESYAKSSIIRLSSGYTGALHLRGNWILAFCRAAVAGKPVIINGSGKQLRDPLHADDLATLILLIASKQAWGRTFNAGGGPTNAYSILEVLNAIDPTCSKEFKHGGDLGYVTDISLAKTELGWQPAKLFNDELAQLVARVKGR